MGRSSTAGNRPARYVQLSGAILCLLSLSCGAVFAQPAVPLSDEIQARIDAAVRALEADPRLKGAPHERVRATADFATGNMLHVVLHEMGHALIDDMYLYVLGREEDAADSYATTAMLRIRGAFSQRALEESAKGWFYSDKRDRAKGQQLAYYDAHGLDQQRAYQIVCLMVGSDPDKYKRLADDTRMPEDRQGTCQGDYNTASWSWDKALKPHLRDPDQPKTDIKVSYGYAAEKDRLDIYAKFLQSIQLLETIAERSANRYVWSAPLTLAARSCGAPDAHWNHPTRTLVLCYEMIAEFVALYRESAQDWKPAAYKRRR
jgi:putative metallopeptidase DUF4344